MPVRDRMMSSSVKSMIILCIMLLSPWHNLSFAQVVSNTGAAISVSSNVVVNSKDLENASGTLINNGTITLTGNYSNGSSGSTSGNGFYNITGHWTDLGSFNPGTSTVSLNGVADQIITHGSTGETFYKLTINSPGYTVTQSSNPGSTLGVLNDLYITAGTLSLSSITSNLTVGGKATVNGALKFNGITTQTTTIKDILGGTGLIDMSGGSLPHLLNLAGATNSIGTFTTSPSGASTVDYNGTDQTVFPTASYRNLIISNSGIKILQGNSIVGLDLTVSGGTFDLGTNTTTLAIYGAADIKGSLSFNGTTTKTVSLTGNLSGAGSIDMSGGNLSHLFNLEGETNSIGSYSSGTGSTVNYLRNGDQTVFTSDDYRNLTVSGTGVKTLNADITAKGILTMSAGDINSNGNILKVSNSAVGAIIRTNGTVIGKLQRAIGVTGPEYLYPVGSASFYNPMKISFQDLISGPLTAQFKAEDIGTAGLPLDDDGNEIYDRYTTGYWSLTSVSPMTSGSFNVNLNHNGFSGIDQSASIIKRTNGGNLEVDGTHGTVTASEITRTTLVNGISTVTTDFAIGMGRPRITRQPSGIDICEGSDASFDVKVRGRGTITYQWQVDTGSGFSDISDGGVYSGATTRELDLTAAPYSMNGYRYRCIVSDGQGHTNITNTVLLTVNKIPVATATPSAQNECPGIAFADIVLGTDNDVPGTTFAWTRTNPSGISTTLPNSGTTSDKISGIFSNTTNNPITVTFTIIPTGPGTTYCVGNSITATVTVNPIAQVFTIPAAITQCDSTTTNIQLTSPSTFTSGFISFKYTVTASGSVTGFTSSVSDLSNNHYITDKLVNQTDYYQTVTYRVVPVSPVGCVDGPAKNVVVTVNPTPRVVAVNIKPEICYGTNTEIVLQSPTVMTTGSILFNYTVSATGPSVSGNMAPENNRPLNYKISRQYQNSSDTLQSVYYSITPKVDNNICHQGKTIISEVKVHPIPLQDLFIKKPLLCNGGSNAVLTVVLSKGSKPDSIMWTGNLGYGNKYITNDNYSDISNLRTAKYYVTVKDRLGCVGKDDQTISGAVLSTYFFVVPKDGEYGYGTTCPEPGANDGELWVKENSSSTGIPPFTYYITYNDNDTIIKDTLSATGGLPRPHKNLHAGNYKLFITDKNECPDDKSVEIVAPPVITVEFDKKKYGNYNVSCKNSSDGYVEVKSVAGGNGEPYRYKWSTGNGLITGIDTLSSLDNISAGTYYLTITDHKGCMKTDSVTLTEPEGMQLVSSSVSIKNDGYYNISCNGGNDGSIEMTIAGGTGTFAYSWTGPGSYTATTEDISGLRAGTYECTVIDQNNCTMKLMPGSVKPSFELKEPPALEVYDTLSVSADGAYNINCNGGTGTIDITVKGGSPGYTYTWSTTDGSGLISGQEDQHALTAGTYHLEIRDINNCPAAIDITLTQPAPLVITLLPTHITCLSPGNNNGSIDLSVEGGIAPYSYSWSNGASSQDISGLTEGYYKVTVTDANGCPKTDSVRINLPQPLTYTANISNHYNNGYNISCNGMADGSIEISPSSGLAPFIYSWTGPAGFTATTAKITGLRAGSYALVITDSNYCTATETFNLTEPGALGLIFNLSESHAGGFNINCAGESTGSISIEPLNQVGEVDYIWSDGASGRERENLPAGNYGVILTDKNNCRASSSVTLTEPDSLKLVFNISKPFCPDKHDGEISLNVTGGVRGTDYSYQWSDNSTSGNISNIPKGFYKVAVTDMNGCLVKDSVNVEPLNESCLIIPNAISPNSDSYNDVWNIGMIELYPEMVVKIFNRWGESLWKSERGYPHPWDGTSNGSPLPIDSYHYIIDLHNGTKPIVGNVTIVR
ncbi:MAG: gliding motility-associated C-terminal domain-containing protein [Bacteroidales bacterium]|nr:gliding motility-associated C-terminal domain-containing protein [Bacteroidales bacterium]